ncbi:MAG: ABC transporter ATP-binding protein [Hormoscilla sp.]
MTTETQSRETNLKEILANTPRLLHLVWTAVPGILLISLTIALIRAALPAAQLIVSKLIIDQILIDVKQTEVDWTPLLTLVGFRFGLSLLQEGLNQVNVYVSQVFKDRFTLHANGVLLAQAVQLDLAHYESSEFHNALSRASKSGSNYPVAVVSTLTTLLGQILTLFSLLTLLLRFSPPIAGLLVITGFPAFWVAVNYSGKRFWMLRSQTESGRLADYLQRLLTQGEYAKEVRLFNLGAYLLQQWRDIRTEFNQTSAALAGKYAAVRGGVGIVSNLGFYTAYIWAVVQAVMGAITLGDFTMYTGAFGQAQNLIPNILQNVANIYDTNLYVGQYFEFLDLQPLVVTPESPKPFPSPLQTGLELRNVSFTYPGSTKPTLVDLNLTVQPGESIALVGLNGAGKTTLLKLLTRLYDVDTGEITLEGIPLPELDLQELRRNIDIIFQDFARYNLSVQDNIGFGNLPERSNMSRLQEASADGGAQELIAGLDRGYETVLGKMFSSGVELSGGQWQKIGMARAFMTNAPILILDEPTAALDALAEYQLFQKFRQLTHGKMTFFVSHRFSTVLLADRIVVLDNSRIVEVGAHAQLMANDGLYARMFRLQASSYNLQETMANC